MKSSYFVLAWTILFIILGLFNHEKINEFSSNYIDQVNVIEEKIKEDKWEQALYILKDTKMNLDEEKSVWYKLVNHGYFNEIFASLEVLNQSICLEEKMISLQEIEKIKMVLENLMEDECCNLNRIF
ncbi:MAG: DUF4363 family protein [Terrisporobacter othiniensis]|uniref:DUF4363 family protein n=1 Tax=Terrisporobacter petrolearius TaxID=1460447 RepID=UPI001D162BE7|nr:DUF4363 family protein [Terrisporobacter petrolearius]MCC3865161.1 DUF4363 family protein [Terrisporobacter petrolearius]MDU4862249.1 DUF4363 family protein [Terrisporobacter othiniensis]MDU6993703.1 DUF4363 family protein [Terrisporobacter othiniensis]